MLILLVILSFFLSCLALWLRENGADGSLRTAFLKAFIIHGILISVVSETLSLTHSLTSHSVALFWLSVDVAISVFLAYRFLDKQASADFKQRFQQVSLRLEKLDTSSRFSLIIVCLILFLTLTTGLLAPPNNYDSMTYHMPRIRHWVQNQSVRPYPTNNLRQISLPPGAAYIATQFQLLAGSDRFANTVQWLAFLGSVLGISLLTNLLVGRNYQWIAALVMTSIPMAIMQSTTTQTDLTTGFWLVAYAFFVFRTDNYTKQDLFWIAASLGMALSTKPTALLFGFPFGVLIVFRLVRRLSLAGSTITIFVFLLAIFSLPFPAYWRNYQLFSSVTGVNYSATITEFGISPVLSAFLKNLLINFPISIFRDFIHFIHVHILGLKIDDLRFNYDGVNIMEEPLLKFLAPHEDFVGSPIHMLLFCGGVLFLLGKWKQIFFKEKNDVAIRRPGRDIFILALTIIAGFLLFCIVLKWQKFHNRMLLPLSILTTPIIIYFVCTFVPRKGQSLLIGLLALSAMFYALTPMRHPLISLPILSAQQLKEQSRSILFLDRKEMYFSGAKKELQEPYRTAAEVIGQRGCSSIGIALREVDWEYPLWVLLESKLQRTFQLKHIGVQNASRQLAPEFPDSQLCAIISSTDLNPAQITGTGQFWQKLAPLSMGESEPGRYLTVYGR